MSTPRPLKRPPEDAMQYTKPNAPRLQWETDDDDARCQVGHSMRYTIDETVVTHIRGRKVPEMRLYAPCHTCLKRAGVMTYQVGFADGKKIRWYAVPGAELYEEMKREWDKRITEEMTQAILVMAWREVGT